MTEVCLTAETTGPGIKCACSVRFWLLAGEKESARPIFDVHSSGADSKRLVAMVVCAMMHSESQADVPNDSFLLLRSSALRSVSANVLTVSCVYYFEFTSRL